VPNTSTFLNTDPAHDSNKQLGFRKTSRPEVDNEETQTGKEQPKVNNFNLTSDTDSAQFNGLTVKGCIVTNENATSSDRSTQHNGMTGSDGQVTNKGAKRLGSNIQVSGLVGNESNLNGISSPYRRFHGNGDDRNTLWSLCF